MGLPNEPFSTCHPPWCPGEKGLRFSTSITGFITGHQGTHAGFANLTTPPACSPLQTDVGKLINWISRRPVFWDSRDHRTNQSGRHLSVTLDCRTWTPPCPGPLWDALSTWLVPLHVCLCRQRCAHTLTLTLERRDSVSKKSLQLWGRLSAAARAGGRRRGQGESWGHCWHLSSLPKPGPGSLSLPLAVSRIPQSLQRVLWTLYPAEWCGRERVGG